MRHCDGRPTSEERPLNEIAGPATPQSPRDPAPYIDRGALSEAWYRALYGTRAQRARETGIDRPGAPAAIARAPEAEGARATATRTPARPPSPLAAGRLGPAFAGASINRIRADRSTVVTPAARAWRAALARRTMCRFTLPSGLSIDLLLQRRDRRLHVSAVSSGGADADAERQIHAALGRARSALAAYGIRLTSDVREKGTA